MAKKNYYVVRKGRVKGIYFSWGDCKKQVDGYAGAEFKGFALLSEAEEWYRSPKPFIPSQQKSKKQTRAELTKRREETLIPVEQFAPNYIAYTDGSCLKNPNGPGGWATVITDTETGEVTELSDGCSSTTNNRMELTAAIMAMSFPEKPSKIAVYTDSQYLQHAFTDNWLVAWKKRGWIKKDGTPVLNQDLWQKLDALYQKHQVMFYWVRGHVGIRQNERCDTLARNKAWEYASR